MSTQVHTLNFLQKVFRSAVNQIFPLDVVKIINNDKIEMENKMRSNLYNKKFNIVKMYNRYRKSLHMFSYDDFADRMDEEYNNKLLSVNIRKNYKPIFNNLNDELIIYHLERILEVNEDDFSYYPYNCYDDIIKLFNDVLEQNDEYNRLVLMYKENNYQKDENQ